MREIQISGDRRSRALVPTKTRSPVLWRKVKQGAVVVLPVTLAVATWVLKNRRSLVPLLKPVKWLWSRRKPKPQVLANPPVRLVYRVMVGEVHIVEQ